MTRIVSHHGKASLHTKPVAGHMAQASKGNRDEKANPIPSNVVKPYAHNTRYSSNTTIGGDANLNNHNSKGTPTDQTKKMDNFFSSGIDTKYIVIGGVLVVGFIYFYVYK